MSEHVIIQIKFIQIRVLKNVFVVVNRERKRCMCPIAPLYLWYLFLDILRDRFKYRPENNKSILKTCIQVVEDTKDNTEPWLERKMRYAQSKIQNVSWQHAVYHQISLTFFIHLFIFFTFFFLAF